MEYNIRISDSGKFFITEVSGEITASGAHEYIKASREFGEKNNLSLNLLDARNAVNKSTVLENYNFGYKDNVVRDFDMTQKLAVLIKKGDASHDFVLTVLKNAGFNIEIFYTFDEAANWLEK